MPHWPNYVIEAALLGTFMLAACTAVVVLEHPVSPLRRRLSGGHVRRAIVGVLMGVTAIALIHSPWGRRSGAHMNPAVTLTFLALGKIAPRDSVGYVAGQFLGGLAGVGAARLLLGRAVMHGSIACAATLPGRRGTHAAWLGEFAIGFTMMSMVLLTTNRPDTAPYTGVLAGTLVALFIAFEAPLSGMSMNPARTLASAVHARRFQGLWVYFTAPPLAMLGAAALYTSVEGSSAVRCAKLDHSGHEPCPFRCGYRDAESATGGGAADERR